MRRGVAPRAGAWSETDHAKTYLAMAGKSRPVRARGLKLVLSLVVLRAPSRAPCGRVD